MTTALRPRTLVLFVGDLLSFALSLWLSLWLRTFDAPSSSLFAAHLEPFSLLFVAWVAVFFIAGLYENRLILFGRRALSATLFTAQVFNVIIAALFFFFIPIFGIAPKTLLVIYLAVSFVVVFSWRAFLFPVLGLQKKEPALIVGERPEVRELAEALRAAPRAPVYPAGEGENPSIIIADWSDPSVAARLSDLPKLVGRGIRFIDAMALYEEVFGREPLSILTGEWFALNVSRYAHLFYDILKRAMDIVIGLTAGIISLVCYPFIALAIWLEDRGPVFVRLPRVGQDGRVIHILKFRSMTGNDQGSYGADGKTALTVTRVGRFLRISRLDEIPQLWAVVRGELSLIGPRPETPALVKLYEREIPHYGMRHLLKPGLSGWAQLYHDNHPHHGTDIAATREKLSYDLYYLKHRSLVLDATVALKTIKKLLTRSGV